MMTGAVRGKALLSLERLDSKWVKYRCVPHIQSSSMVDGKHLLHEEFDCLSTESLPVPNVARKMRIGDRIVVSVVYEITYHTDYFGEVDVDLVYHKERVLRRRRAA